MPDTGHFITMPKEAYGSLAAGDDGAVPPAPPPRRRSTLPLLAAVGLLACAGALLVRGASPSSPGASAALAETDAAGGGARSHSAHSSHRSDAGSHHSTERRKRERERGDDDDGDNSTTTTKRGRGDNSTNGDDTAERVDDAPRVSVDDDVLRDDLAEGDAIEVEIDLRQFEEVDSFLKSKGISENSTADEILQWVPDSIVLRYWRSRVEQEIGEDASKGYVTFNLVSTNTDEQAEASYLIVMTLDGTIVSLKVITAWSETKGSPHFNGLKMRDPEHLLLAQNADSTSESGSNYVYEWKTKTFLELMNGDWGLSGSAHDLQWEDDAGSGTPGVWRPYTSGFSFQDAYSGEYLQNWTFAHVNDINHVQAIDYGTPDEYVILNSRGTDAMCKVNLTTGVIAWFFGGTHGTLDLIDFDGTRYAAGTKSLFFGQHNGEYFGDGEYMMFDNNYNMTSSTFVGDQSPSRLLIVAVDEEANTATLKWEYVLDDRSDIFGDNDRLPSGNLLGCSWPQTISPDATWQYDARAFEIVRESKEVAWEMYVIGTRCNPKNVGYSKGTGCTRSPHGGVGLGWSLYSVERFYPAPLVWDIDCVGAATADAGITMRFTAVNSFKQNNQAIGRFMLIGDGDSTPVVEPTDFAFNNFWRGTNVTFATTDADSTFTGHLVVTNQWGDNSTKAVTCR